MKNVRIDDNILKAVQKIKDETGAPLQFIINKLCTEALTERTENK